MKYLIPILFLILGNPSGFSQKITFRILQFNDIYETGPLSGGKEGGPARVAAYRQKLLKSGKPLFTVLPGDFLSPSVMNSVVYQDQKVKGRQMIELLNAMQVDLVTFGNHEFDLKETELQARINESQFAWISSNVYQKTPQGLKPFEKTDGLKSDPFLPCTTLVVKNKKGQELKVGFVGVTLSGFKPAYAEIKPFAEAAKTFVDTLKLRDQAQLMLALSHLNIEEDRELAKAVPALKLIMGGHEHQAHTEMVGKTRIAKADANVRSVYLHSFSVRLPKTPDAPLKCKATSKLKYISDKMPEEPKTAAVDKKWKQIAFDSFRAQGFEPEKVIYKTETPLEGLEASVRNKPTNLGGMIAKAYQQAFPEAQAGLLNSGSIRIDDNISGNITEYDVLRILPFGGKVVMVELSGALLVDILKAGLLNQGSGGYLQYSGLKQEQQDWYIQQEKINPEKYYTVAMTDFLLTGQEKNLGYLKEGNPQIRRVVFPDPSDNTHPGRDVRFAVIRYFQDLNP